MARSPLLGRLSRLMRVLRASRRTGVNAGELLETSRARRQFLKSAGGVVAASALLGAAGCSTGGKSRLGGTDRRDQGGSGDDRRDSPPAATAPRVAIVGAGIAGLNCARILEAAGITAYIYEASPRTGGRMMSSTDMLNPGQTVELGAEFIDTAHTDMLELAAMFELELLDMHDDDEVRDTAYFLGGRHYSDREVLDALAPFAARMERDARWLEQDWSLLQSDRVAREIDNMSISAYLESIGVEGWLKTLLEVAFVTEYGLDADEQSAFNLLCIIGLDTDADQWGPFGESDERFKVNGGNQLIVDRLAELHPRPVYLEHRLVRVRQRGDVLDLTFRHGGSSVDVRVDYVVLTMPFTLLREVELEFDMPAEKRRCIDKLGYGMNAKLCMGTSSRPWREQGFAGGVFSDEAFQLAWDSARLNAGNGGAITLYSGGKPGIEVGEGNPASQLKRLLPGLEKAFPGVTATDNGRHFRMHWPSYRWSKSSYACYLPGQWGTVHGWEGESVGNVLFAGEHCSEDWQGFMQGGAETGRMAAEELLEAVRR